MAQVELQFAPPIVVQATIGAPAAVPAGVSGLPLPAAPTSGLCELHGPCSELSVYAQLGPDWSEAWIRLLARIDQMDVPLDLKRGQDLQSPLRTSVAAAVAGQDVGLLFRVSGRPATFYRIEVYTVHGIALSEATFIMVGTPGSGPTQGDRADRSVVDLWGRPHQLRHVAVHPAPLGPVFPLTGGNPTGGRTGLSGLSWSTDDTTPATLLVQDLTLAGAVTQAVYRSTADGVQIVNPFTPPLWSRLGASWQAVILGGGAIGTEHALNVQVIEE
ncbi:MAG: hypothetical protein A2V88_08280 [Elusimicrobia bacterium RBG_16_66_12]|nr:MAG: hypothetical protein A2V88_08280 [Elusimicrobia bacterium RBG_16_66_12]